MKGRLLGVDWGEKRIGLALSDESQRVAHPLVTLTRRIGKRFPMPALLDALRTNAVVGVVLGLPLEADGSEAEPAGAARTLAATIERRAGLPVTLWDERMTTARALRAVREVGGGDTRGRRGDVDALAATVLLQHYLDTRRGTAT